MEFEFDTNKSASNKVKHGIDFTVAQLLWKDINRIEIPARNITEPRYLLIALINRNIWSAIFTYCKNFVRIISVRKARRNEKEIYYGKRV